LPEKTQFHIDFTRLAHKIHTRKAKMATTLTERWSFMMSSIAAKSALAKNLVLFKIGWTACVVGAAYGMGWIGVLAATVLVLEHLRTHHSPAGEAWVLAMAACIGLGWESLMVSSGLVNYGEGFWTFGLAPLWIIALWIMFASTLNLGMRWMKAHPLVAATAGAIGGPLSFYSGSVIGAVEFSDPAVSLTVIGIGWAFLLPVMTHLADRFSGENMLIPATVRGGAA
jgi:hypothetical protein